MRLRMITALLLICVISIVQGYDYTVTDVGHIGGNHTYGKDINNLGQVVGYGRYAAYVDHAFLYDPVNGISDLGTMESGTFSRATSINDNGVIVGDAGYESTNYHKRPFKVVGGTKSWLFSSSSDYGYPVKINNNGIVVGYYYTGSITNTKFKFDISTGTRTTITVGGSSITDINNLGQITQTWSSTSGQVGFIHSDGSEYLLGTFGGSSAASTAVNDLGMIVGYAKNSSNISRAYAWRPELRNLTTGHFRDLGDLGGTGESVANDVNIWGEVVGRSNYKAWVYKDGALQDLNNLVEPVTGRTLDSGIAINDKGQILVQGYENGYIRTFILTPIH